MLQYLLLLAAVPSVQGARDVQLLRLPAVAAAETALEIELDGVPRALVLEPFTLRSPEFKLLSADASGGLVEVAPGPCTTWRGYLEGAEGSTALASITEAGMTAYIVDEQSQRSWQVEPADASDRELHIVTPIDEIARPSGGTFEVLSNGAPTISALAGTSRRSAGLGSIKVVEIAVDADHEYYLRNGASVDGTLADIEFMLSASDELFRRDVDITLELKFAVIRSSVMDPYSATTSVGAVTEFRAEWQAQFASFRYDQALMFSDRDVGVATAIAYPSATCSDRRYGVTWAWFTSLFDLRRQAVVVPTAVNLGATLCSSPVDCRVLCGVVGGCTGDVSRFGAQGIAEMRAYVETAMCLSDLSSPVLIPAVERFVSTQLDRSLWIVRQRVSVTAAATGAPSLPYSVELGSEASSGGPIADRLITNEFALGGLTGVELRLATRDESVGAGETFVVEHTDPAGNWLVLGEVASDGVTQAAFDQQLFVLPPAALYDGVQFRLGPGSASPGSWFIDDFTVTDNTCGQVENYCPGAPNTVSILGASLTHLGSTSIATNDFTLVAGQCPPSSFGIYIFGNRRAVTPAGDGTVCVGGAPAVYRAAIAQANAQGQSMFALDQTSLPPGAAIGPGERFNFQLWYRDATPGGFNFTEGLSVVFCP